MGTADDVFFPKHPVRRAFGHSHTHDKSALTWNLQSKERTKGDGG